LFSFSGCKNNDNEVTGVTIYPSVCVLEVGETKHLTAIVTPDNADDTSVRWDIQTVFPKDTANAQDVAKISENGKVTGIVEGLSSAICVTNNMFYQAKALVIVGYASAVVGIYTGSLSENDGEPDTNAKIGIDYIRECEATEREAEIGLSFLKVGQRCPITVDYWGEKMKFSGETTMNLDEVMTPVKVSGIVTLHGVGEFTILVGDAPVTNYSFTGILKRPPLNQ